MVLKKLINCIVMANIRAETLVYSKISTQQIVEVVVVILAERISSTLLFK